MGNLSDAAKRGFKKGLKQSSVPEWMILAQWVALGLLPLIVLVSLLQPDNNVARESNKPVSVVSTKPRETNSFNNDNGGVVRVKSVNGKFVKVSSSAVEVAQKAGLALWTGRWENVPISGNPVSGETLFPNARIGNILVFAATDDFVTFAIKLDAEGDGSFDQSFQISVVKESGRWVYLV